MNIARDQLRSFIERIERLEEERKGIADDIADIYGEAKSTGYDAKALRQIVRERRQDTQERDAFEAVIDTYRAALGMLPGHRHDQARNGLAALDGAASAGAAQD
jgi:uncharacterized protein (UPF0335 family)